MWPPWLESSQIGDKSKGYFLIKYDLNLCDVRAVVSERIAKLQCVVIPRGEIDC